MWLVNPSWSLTRLGRTFSTSCAIKPTELPCFLSFQSKLTPRNESSIDNGFLSILTLITIGFGQNSLYTSKSMFTDIKAHDIGDVINHNHQNEPLEICYGDNLGETIYLGNNNSGITVLGLENPW